MSLLSYLTARLTQPLLPGLRPASVYRARKRNEWGHYSWVSPTFRRQGPCEVAAREHGQGVYELEVKRAWWAPWRFVCYLVHRQLDAADREFVERVRERLARYRAEMPPSYLDKWSACGDLNALICMVDDLFLPEEQS